MKYVQFKLNSIQYECDVPFEEKHIDSDFSLKAIFKCFPHTIHSTCVTYLRYQLKMSISISFNDCI